MLVELGVPRTFSLNDTRQVERTHDCVGCLAILFHRHVITAKRSRVPADEAR